MTAIPSTWPVSQLPRFIDEVIHIFKGTGLSRPHGAGAGEVIEERFSPRRNPEDDREPRITDAKTLVGLFMSFATR
jgi:hypothetical protein